MATAQALIDYLKASGTGENKLKPMRALVKSKPEASAADALQLLEQLCGEPRANDRPYPERIYAPGTMQKAREFMESQQRPKAKELAVAK